MVLCLSGCTDAKETGSGKGTSAEQACPTTGGPAASEGELVITLRKNIHYITRSGHRLLLDIYLPQQQRKLLPLVIFIHGGGWDSGSKEYCPVEPLVENGFAAACINYRLSSMQKFPAQLMDAKAAVRWLRKNGKKYCIDTSRIGVWGISAGGHLAALLGTSDGVKALREGGALQVSSRVQAVVDWFGPTDFSKVDLTQYRRYGLAVTGLIGRENLQHSARIQQANPISYVSGDDPPFLIVHGDQDTVVPLQQSQILHRALKDKGVNARLVTVRGAGHVGGFVGEHYQMVVSFFDAHLR